jgi:membrane protease YdiL (CAAX protease family)
MAIFINKFFGYLVLSFSPLIFISGRDESLYWLFFCYLFIFSVNFKKKDILSEKLDLDFTFLVNLASSLLFVSSIYFLFYSIATNFVDTTNHTFKLESSIEFIVYATVFFPILEELFFRKFFFHCYRNVLSLGKLIALNGIFFSIVHVFADISFLHAFIYGCSFMLIYLHTLKIIYTVMCHIVVNALVLLTNYNKSLVIYIKDYNFSFLIISSLVTTFFFYYLVKKIKSSNFKNKNHEEGE